MFKFQRSLDVLTLFHSARSESSKRVLSALKAANTAAEESSVNADAAGDKKQIFELDVVEGPMTTTQLRSILDYVGDAKVADIVDGAKGVSDAMKILEKSSSQDVIKRPIVVDWNNGKVVFGEQQSAIRQLVESLPKN